MALLDAQVARIPARQEELAALEQEEEILSENYSDALRKLQDSELAQSLELAQQGIRVSLLDSALLGIEEVESLTGMMTLGEIPRAS